MRIEPYLHFHGRCEEALEFYRRTLGAETAALMRYKDSPEPLSPEMVPAGMEDKIMHSVLRVGDSVVMASDDCTRTQSVFAGFQLTLSVADAAEAEHRFAALTEGGEVRMPLRETFFRRELNPPTSARRGTSRAKANPRPSRPDARTSAPCGRCARDAAS